MDDVQKGKIRLTHWIDHNLDHLKGYAEVADTLEKHQLTAPAQSIREGIRLIEAANAAFEKALAEIPANPETVGHGHATDSGAATHSHEHAHEHEETHTHDHDHHHGHTHAHEHQLEGFPKKQG